MEFSRRMTLYCFIKDIINTDLVNDYIMISDHVTFPWGTTPWVFKLMFLNNCYVHDIGDVRRELNLIKKRADKFGIMYYQVRSVHVVSDDDSVQLVFYKEDCKHFKELMKYVKLVYPNLKEKILLQINEEAANDLTKYEITELFGERI